jgi:hypothetical protein
MKITTLAVALIALFSLSCKQTVVVHDAPYLGEMTGRILPFDVNSDSMPNQLMGTHVWIKGTSYVTTTDLTGQWTFNNLPAGIYTILFWRPGFDTGGLVNHKFSGSGIDFVDRVSVTRIPTDIITLDYAQLKDTLHYGEPLRSLVVGGHVSSTQSQRVFIHYSVDSGTTWDVSDLPNALVVDGKFSSSILSQLLIHNRTVTLNDLVGQKLLVRMELFPLSGYPFGVGSYVPDYSNSIEVSIQ